MLSTKEGLLVKVEWVQLSKFQEIQEVVVVKPVITVRSVDICWSRIVYFVHILEKMFVPFCVGGSAHPILLHIYIILISVCMEYNILLPSANTMSSYIIVQSLSSSQCTHSLSAMHLAQGQNHNYYSANVCHSDEWVLYNKQLGLIVWM